MASEKGGLRIRSRSVESGTATAAAAIDWHHCICFALQTVADIVWDITGEVAVITGAQEEGHSDGRHDGRRGDYRCRAFDLSTRSLNTTPEIRRHVLGPLFLLALGPAFKILNEGNHYHFAYIGSDHWSENLPRNPELLPE